MSFKPGDAVVIDGGEIKLENRICGGEIKLKSRICGEIGVFYPTGSSQQKHDTTANWEARISYIPKAGEIIVYTDYLIIDGILIPCMKIGDGETLLSDLPFISSGFGEHNKLIHREYPNQHPISAIDGLTDALAAKANLEDLSIIYCGTSTEVI